MCTSVINNGHLELLNDQNGNDQYSGQSAQLVCGKSYFLKVADVCLSSALLLLLLPLPPSEQADSHADSQSNLAEIFKFKTFHQMKRE